MDNDNQNYFEELKIDSDLVLLKAQDIADMIRISKSMAYQLMQRGEIKTVKFGRSVRVRPSDLDRFINKSLIG